MQVEEQTLLFFRNTVGLKPLETAAGLGYFEAILNGNVSQILPLQANRKKISSILGLEAAVSGTAITGEGAGHPVNLAADLLEQTQQAITGVISRLMKLDEAVIHPDQDLGEYGMSSITFTDAAGAVNDTFQVRMTPAVFLNIRRSVHYLPIWQRAIRTNWLNISVKEPRRQL